MKYVGCFFSNGEQYYFGRDGKGYPVGPHLAPDGYLKVLSDIRSWDRKYDAAGLNDGDRSPHEVQNDRDTPADAGVRHIIKLPNGDCIVECRWDDGSVSYHVFSTEATDPIAATRDLSARIAEQRANRHSGFDTIAEAAATFPEESVLISAELESTLEETLSRPGP